MVIYRFASFSLDKFRPYYPRTQGQIIINWRGAYVVACVWRPFYAHDVKFLTHSCLVVLVEITCRPIVQVHHVSSKYCVYRYVNIVLDVCFLILWSIGRTRRAFANKHYSVPFKVKFQLYRPISNAPLYVNLK